jgi:hypothetical protein
MKSVPSKLCPSSVVAVQRYPRYEGQVNGTLSVRVAAAALAGCAASCTSFPPAITGITIFPADAAGQPRGPSVCRTAAQRPIPVIGLRPGTDPRRGAMWLNDPSSGLVRITLARGRQNFVLYCAQLERSDHFVIAVYLDDESTPSLTALVDGKPGQPVRASAASLVRGFDGTLLPNHSSQSLVRGAYRITVQGGAFPLDGVSVDPLGPWALKPDGIPDLTGILTIDVEPEASGATDQRHYR